VQLEMKKKMKGRVRDSSVGGIIYTVSLLFHCLLR